MSRVLSLCLIITNLIRTTLEQTTNGFGCCSMNMMDAGGRVVMETRRQLTSGTFVALRVRACATDPTAVQIWRLAGNGAFNFRWQTVISPVLSTTTQTFITVKFATSLVLTSDDRLGLFSPFDPTTTNASTLISIPFGFDENNYYLYYSSSTFNGFADFGDLVGGVTSDDLRWPRSFVGSVFFCQKSDCSDVGSQTSSMVSMTLPPYPPSTAPDDQCCPNGVACNTSGIDAFLANQTKALKDLKDEINDIASKINALLSSRLAAGLCPQGFTPGAYGVGKCFLLIRDRVPMASAALQCQTVYDSLLMQINSAVDEVFLRTFLSGISTSGEESFWTAGMFNRDSRRWVWYDENQRVKSPMTYTNWMVGLPPPTPSADDDVCMKLVVTQAAMTNSSRWVKTDCNERNFYVCQVYKTCP